MEGSIVSVFVILAYSKKQKTQWNSVEKKSYTEGEQSKKILKVVNEKSHVCKEFKRIL